MENESQTNRDRARKQPYDTEYKPGERRPFHERPNAFHALAWLLEGATGLVEELHHNDLGLSEKFWTHAYAARRETLLALRAALDDLIEHSESQTRQAQERQQRRERSGDVKIEF